MVNLKPKSPQRKVRGLPFTYGELAELTLLGREDIIRARMARKNLTHDEAKAEIRAELLA